MKPRGPRNHESPWAILRQNAKDAVTTAPKDSPLLLILTIVLGLLLLALLAYASLVGF